MNADPVVMRYFAGPFTRERSDLDIDRYLAAFDREGFSFFAATLRDSGDFIGTIGLQTMRDVVPNLPQPAVEIGWRLARPGQRTHHRRRTRHRRLRLQPTRPQRSRRHHRTSQPRITPRHGKTRHDPPP